MRLRLTILLFLANIALFASIWLLEREPSVDVVRPENLVVFTTLEISGKSIDKPRVLKFENNKWRIVSPINWRANLFAVNRIRNQIEFIDKEANFPLSELNSRGYKLSDYGLDEPAYLIKYGNGKKMYTLKIGKSASVGDRIYLLDEEKEKVFVVDKEFVDGIVVDTERLRDQNVFDIPRFEVSTFSVRLPSKESENSLKGNFRRIGLVRDGASWKIETPIAVPADLKEVEGFLTTVCQLTATSFPDTTSVDTGFEVSALPTTLTLEGTNRRQVLLLGSKTQDGKQIYAKLEDNPTIFTLDASIVELLANMQTSLRDKALTHFDISKVASMTISKDGKSLKFDKLKGGTWDVHVVGKDSVKSFPADAAKVNKILMAFAGTKASEFVSDVPSGDLSRYGITANALQILVTSADQSVASAVIGNNYTSTIGKKLMYARSGGYDAVVGISDELASLLGTNINDYRSRVLDTISSKITSIALTELKTGKVLINLKAKNGIFDMTNLDARERVAGQRLIDYAKNFAVKKYISSDFNEKGAFAVGKLNPWEYELKVTFEVNGTASATEESRSWMLSKRVGGMTQYGGCKKTETTFLLESVLIDSIFEFTQKSIESSELKKPEVVAPKKK